MKAQTERAAEDFEDLQTANIVASGYETCCPECDTVCDLIEVPRWQEAVVCPDCGCRFRTDDPEHAIG